MLNAGVLTFQEFAMREPLPLATIPEALLDFLRGRKDVVLFGAQAVNAYVSEPRMTQDVNLLSTDAKNLAEELRTFLSEKFHIAVRVGEVADGKGFRIFQIRSEGNRHLIDLRAISEFPATEKIEDILVLSPVELIASKVVSFHSRKGKPKAGTDYRDLGMLLLRFPQLNVEQITKQGTLTNPDKRIENLKKQAREKTQALINGDYKKFAESVYVPSFIADKYPEKIKDFRERAALESKKQLEQLKSEGFNFEIIVDEPQAIVSGDNKLFSIVPTNNISRVKEGQEIKDVNGNNVAKGRYEMKGFMLGVSQDGGETWQFMDVDEPKQFELFFPEASKKLTLPTRTKPTYYPE